jgi:hypothetical protein
MKIILLYKYTYSEIDRRKAKKRMGKEERKDREKGVR